MDGDSLHGLIDAAEATRLLGVNRATLYAYVSRGLIHSEMRPGDARARRYSASDVERLIWQKTRARKPSAAAATALSWGLPVLETRVSQIDKGTLTYRGHDIAELAREGSLEAMAGLLWNTPANPFARTRFNPADVPGWSATAELLAQDRAIDRAIALMALVRRIPNTECDSFVVAARLVQALAATVVTRPLDTGRDLHEALAEAWGKPAAAGVIRRILVCSADHELNTSTFTVRVVASTHVDLATCLLTGLTAFCGYEHTGLIAEARSLLREAEHADDLDAFAERKAQSANPLPGFFHRLYPDGDPRAAEILAHAPLTPTAVRLIDAVGRATGLRPNIELALVVVEAAYDLPTGAAEAMFATGRSVGWIAHALEQQASGTHIRPRSHYAGRPVRVSAP
jgi:citrate synthase